MMLKTIFFVSIIIKLAFGEEGFIDEEVADGVTIGIETLDLLTKHIQVNNDEIEAELARTCKAIKTKNKCRRALSVQAPNGITTNRKGNNGPGECMWFNRKRNKIVQVFGNQCIPPAAVRSIKRNLPDTLFSQQEDIDDIDDDNDDDDTVEMDSGLFDSLSQSVPDDELSDDGRNVMKYCLEINKKTKCMNMESRVNPGLYTGRRGNEGPGECMWFTSFRNPVVVNYNGQRCLPPRKVVMYNKANRPLTDDDESQSIIRVLTNNLLLSATNENGLDYNYILALGLVVMALTVFAIYYKCKAKNEKKEGIIRGETRPYQYLSV